MVDAVSSASSSSSSSSSSGSSALSASYDMFLQLLCTQLQTQNPLDPMDATQFTQQLATYASLEQQINTNDKLDQLISSLSATSMSSGVGYLGHTVEADSDTLTMGSDGTVDASWTYTLGSSADSVTLSVVDSSGKTVWTGSGDTASGAHSFEWDGTDSDGNPVAAGDYTLKVTAEASDGTSVTSSIGVKGTVTAIDNSSGTAVLEIGDTKVALDDVTRLAA